jgi:hypothetical protein
MTRRHAPVFLAVVLLAAAAASAQTPALSGLSPTPTPPAATSGDATPEPTPAPKLKSVAGPAAETGHSGQSLADVVRVSKEARKDQKPKKSLGTITNETLHKGTSTTSTTAVTAKGASKTPAASTARKEPTPAPTYDVPRDDQGRSEAQWKATMDHARSLVGDGERRVRELETKSKQLENDFYAQSDGYRRDGVIKPAWDKSRDDLAKARVDLDAARKSLEDLSEDARRSNAPPGWLR